MISFDNFLDRVCTAVENTIAPFVFGSIGICTALGIEALSKTEWVQSFISPSLRQSLPEGVIVAGGVTVAAMVYSAVSGYLNPRPLGNGVTLESLVIFGM